MNFVPVINGDVRRWFKSDSLWQAQNPNYTADQVLIIPGPEAVTGIGVADEPIADLLGRYEACLVQALEQNGAPQDIAGYWQLSESPSTTVFARKDSETGVEFRVLTAGGTADLTALAREFEGPLAGLLLTPFTFRGTAAVSNPLRRLLQVDVGASFRAERGASGELQGLEYVSSEGERVWAKWATPTTLQWGICPLDDAGEEELVFELNWVLEERNGFFVESAQEYDERVAAFYQRRLFGSPLEAPACFEPMETTLVVDGERVRGYHGVTGGSVSDEVPLNMVFSLAWEPIFTVMSTPELSKGLLRLVHLSNDFELHSGWPMRAGETLEVSARVTRVEKSDSGKNPGDRCNDYPGRGIVRDLDVCIFRSPILRKRNPRRGRAKMENLESDDALGCRARGL